MQRLGLSPGGINSGSDSWSADHQRECAKDPVSMKMVKGFEDMEVGHGQYLLHQLIDNTGEKEARSAWAEEVDIFI